MRDLHFQHILYKQQKSISEIISIFILRKVIKIVIFIYFSLVAFLRVLAGVIIVNGTISYKIVFYDVKNINKASFYVFVEFKKLLNMNKYIKIQTFTTRAVKYLYVYCKMESTSNFTVNFPCLLSQLTIQHVLP